MYAAFGFNPLNDLLMVPGFVQLCIGRSATLEYFRQPSTPKDKKRVRNVIVRFNEDMINTSYENDNERWINDLTTKIQDVKNCYNPDRIFMVIEAYGRFGSILAFVARKNKCVTTLINKFDQTKRFAKDVNEETRRYSRELGAYIRQHNLLID